MRYFRKENPTIPKNRNIQQRKLRKEDQMAKTKNRIKKMNFQTKARSEMPELSEDDKYIIEMAGYKKGIGRLPNENLHRITRGAPRPQYI